MTGKKIGNLRKKKNSGNRKKEEKIEKGRTRTEIGRDMRMGKKRKRKVKIREQMEGRK